MSDDYVIRPANFGARGERGFVIKAWLSCDRATPQARADGTEYMRRQSARIEAILANPKVLVLVAQNSFDDALDGFSVREGPSILHYVYVRRAVHRVGLARRLCVGLEANVSYTHTPVDREVRIPHGWTFDPKGKESKQCA